MRQVVVRQAVVLQAAIRTIPDNKQKHEEEYDWVRAKAFVLLCLGIQETIFKTYLIVLKFTAN